MKVTSISIPSDLKDRLEYTARLNCRSLSAEIVFRLRSSFREESAQDIERFKVLASGPRGD
jgi:hypothetical protein